MTGAGSFKANVNEMSLHAGRCSIGAIASLASFDKLSSVSLAMKKLFQRLYFKTTPAECSCKQTAPFKLLNSFLPATMPGEATETVPVTEQEMQQPQVETGSY